MKKRLAMFRSLRRSEAVALGFLAGSVVVLLVLVAVLPDKIDLVRRSVPVAARSGPDLNLPNWAKEIDAFEARKTHSVDEVTAFFARIGYDPEVVRWWDEAVPQLLLQELPKDIKSVSVPEQRKWLFISITLPLILAANREIAEMRERLSDLEWRVKAGAVIPEDSRAELRKLAKRYKIDPAPENLKKLLSQLLDRVDMVPTDLALAQAAAESGWGTSRFARKGQALFGQWTWDEDAGIKPAAREAGKTHAVRAFDSLLDSVRAYMFNLNTSSHYRDFRRARAKLRRRDAVLSGEKLVRYLDKYSERGTVYIEEIRGLIRSNRLNHFNSASLARST